jgi:hypothetical protein
MEARHANAVPRLDYSIKRPGCRAGAPLRVYLLEIPSKNCSVNPLPNEMCRPCAPWQQALNFGGPHDSRILIA